jgi:hypothetical protein
MEPCVADGDEDIDTQGQTSRLTNRKEDTRARPS